MRWRELITEIYETRTQPSGIAGKPEFYLPASAASIGAAEAAVQAVLPDSLRSLLMETNGVMDMMAIDGGEWFKSMWLLWAIEEIVEQNRFNRSREKGTYERDFDSLVFFAGAGTDGILFAFPAEDGLCGPQVVVWHPIGDELDNLAPSLDEFLRGWLTSTISV